MFCESPRELEVPCVQLGILAKYPLKIFGTSFVCKSKLLNSELCVCLITDVYYEQNDLG